MKHYSGWHRSEELLDSGELELELEELELTGFASTTGSGAGGDGGSGAGSDFLEEDFEDDEDEDELEEEESFFFCKILLRFGFTHFFAMACIGDLLLQSCDLQPGPALQITRKGELVRSVWYQS